MSRRVTRRHVMRHFTGNGTDQCQDGSSHIPTSYREQPRPTRIVVAYLRPAFSATARTNCAPISFDQHATENTVCMGCQSNKVINSGYKSFSSSQKVIRRQVMRHFTSNSTDPCRNYSSNLLPLYLEQSRSTQSGVAPEWSSR